MPHLFSADGTAALAQVLQLQPLLAFDFDGTLAPIVARPEDARLSQAVAARLKALAAQRPLAIVSGRSAADVRARLGFAPQFVVGNHGAEGAFSADAEAAHARDAAIALAGLREDLQRHATELHAVGVTVEDKGASIALHYRLSRQREAAVQLLEQLLTPADPAWRVFGGKMVVNVAPADAPDKARAVHALVARCGAGAAIYAGDDVNDEPVFAAAPPHWLTVRVGRDDPNSRARFALEGPGEVAMLLERLLLSSTLPTHP